MDKELSQAPAQPAAGGGPTRVPDEASGRTRLREAVQRYAVRSALTPPLTIDELQGHARAILAAEGAAPELADFVTVLVGNEAWRETVAAIPFDRRVLLLPQCLRDRSRCKAVVDELGVLCEQCGACAIGALQAEAEALGYVVLVAEGTTVVTKLLEQGRIDAVIGVSCLAVLERAFPHLTSAAIPGIAIPLTRDGCNATAVDVEAVREALHLESRDAAFRIDLDGLRREIEALFAPESLAQFLGSPASAAEDVAAAWLAKSGNRWRPYLAAAVYRACARGAGPLPGPIRRAAVAVECFHKASLAHDDIEDGDELRYGERTLHCEHGLPIALNAGDLLVGEGYRMISESGLDSARVAQMLAVATRAHRSLCVGQGAELAWLRRPRPIPSAEVLDIFRRKTAPAFEVALRFGAICAGADEAVGESLRRYSEAIGTAYQVGDDIQDFHSAAGGDAAARRPSLLFALACECATPAERQPIEAAWLARTACADGAPAAGALVLLRAEEKARQLYEHYRNEAVRALNDVANAELRAVLRRFAARMLRVLPA